MSVTEIVPDEIKRYQNGFVLLFRPFYEFYVMLKGRTSIHSEIFVRWMNCLSSFRRLKYEKPNASVAPVSWR